MIVRQENKGPTDADTAKAFEELLDAAITAKDKYPLVRFTLPEHVRDEVLNRYRTQGGWDIKFSSSSRSGSHFVIENL